MGPRRSKKTNFFFEISQYNHHQHHHQHRLAAALMQQTSKEKKKKMVVMVMVALLQQKFLHLAVSLRCFSMKEKKVTSSTTALIRRTISCITFSTRKTRGLPRRKQLEKKQKLLPELKTALYFSQWRNAKQFFCKLLFSVIS